MSLSSPPATETAIPAAGATMRAAIWREPGLIELSEVELPEVPEGWALIRTAYVGLCGTDLAIFGGHHPRAAAPLIMGHEFSGTVIQSKSSGIQPADKVMAEPLITCGQCRACTEGDSHVCRNLRLYGIDYAGGLAEYVALPGDRLHVLPQDVDLRIAALAEPLAVAVHANAAVRIGVDDVVAVIGGGPIGLLTALVAQHQGAGRVAVAEPNETRRRLAQELGLDAYASVDVLDRQLKQWTDGEGADVTFDCAGHPSAAAQLSGLTRGRGTIILAAVYKHPAELDLRSINFQEQILRGVRVYTRADVQRAVGLISAGILPLDRLSLQVFGLEKINDAFAAAKNGAEAIKVLVSPSRNSGKHGTGSQDER
jgi:(R,R)-butanediol dehydrogenase/meso-butanediol dehydrogenase/diacetyl reductase